MSLRLQKSILLSALVALVLGCGGAGKKKSSGGGGSVSTVTGSIIGQTGRATGYEGWMVVLIDKASGESRIGEIDAKGLYELKNVSSGHTFTIILLNKEFRVSSVLSMIAANQEGMVKQYFKIIGSSIPTIVHKGQNCEFSDETQVQLQSDVAGDANTDGIVDGLDNVGESDLSADSASVVPSGISFSLATADTDGDGIANNEDPDIDGDGLANWFDDDDDEVADSYDVFDLDANDDNILDAAQKIGDHYFKEYAEYIAVQHFVQLGDEPRNFLKFSVKLQSGVAPESVRVRGSATMLDEAQIAEENEDGEIEAGDIWDRLLNDDGLSQDGSAGDGLYSIKVELQPDQAPANRQVMFIQLGFGGSTNEWFREFPYTFPTFDIGTIEATYNDGDLEISKSGDPFGENSSGDAIEDYMWSVSVYNTEGVIVHSSETMAGTTESYTLPDDILEDGEEYTAKIFAQSLDRVTGYPAFVVESEAIDLE